MMHPQLTATALPAKLHTMQGKGQNPKQSGRRAVRAGMFGAMVVASAMMLSGCVTVSAPDKPIVIELNINIKQEVVYKLDKGVTDLIDKNSEIF
jgi:hypothetical protein